MGLRADGKLFLDNHGNSCLIIKHRTIGHILFVFKFHTVMKQDNQLHCHSVQFLSVHKILKYPELLV